MPVASQSPEMSRHEEDLLKNKLFSSQKLSPVNSETKIQELNRGAKKQINQ